MIKLYDYELSGNCYKLRLMMSFLGVEYEAEAVDFYPGNQHKSEEFRQINPLGQLPVIDDDGLILRDAQAILVYLASEYDASGKWYPRDNPAMLGQIAQWLAFADGITATASAARLHDAMFYTHIDVDAAPTGAHKLFRILDEHLFSPKRPGRTGSAPARIRPSPMSPVFLTSCWPKKVAYRAWTTPPSAAGATASNAFRALP